MCGIVVADALEQQYRTYPHEYWYEAMFVPRKLIPAVTTQDIELNVKVVFYIGTLQCPISNSRY